MAISADQNPDARRLALGAAVNMGIDDVRIFVELLRGSGYRGDIAMLVRLQHFALKKYLHGHDVATFHDCAVRIIASPTVHTRRFRFFRNFLRAHGNRYDEVLISDVRDVVFQKHPFHDLDLSVCNFYLESAKYTIGTEGVNARWVGLFLKPDEVTRIAPCRISCCGVTLGPAAQIARYTEVIIDSVAALWWRLRRKVGTDTAFHNRIAHISHEVPSVLVENNRHVATMGLEPAESYRISADNVVSAADGTVPAILHQYDRHPAVLAAIKRRFTGAPVRAEMRG